MVNGKAVATHLSKHESAVQWWQWGVVLHLAYSSCPPKPLAQLFERVPAFLPFSSVPGMKPKCSYLLTRSPNYLLGPLAALSSLSIAPVGMMLLGDAA